MISSKKSQALLLIIIIIIIFKYNYRRAVKKPIRRFVQYDDISPYLSTGDILLMNHNTWTYGFDSIFGDELTHCGIIIKDEPTTDAPDGLFVLEVTEDCGMLMFVPRQGSLHLFPLKNRIRTYDGYCCLRLLSPGLTPEEEIALKDAYAEYVNSAHVGKYIKDLVPHMLRWWFVFPELFPSIYSANKYKINHCSGIIASLYKDIGIVDCTLSHMHIRPEAFKHSVDGKFGIKFNQGHSLSEVVEVLVDPKKSDEH